MRKVRRTVNRVLLGLAGAVLFGAGASVLTAGLDLPAKWHFTLPENWPWTGPDGVLLSEENRTRWTDSGWWWPTVIAALAVLLLLAPVVAAGAVPAAPAEPSPGRQRGR